MATQLTDTGVASAAGKLQSTLYALSLSFFLSPMLILVMCTKGGTMSNNNRSGTMFISQRDVYFTSNHIPLLGVVQKVPYGHTLYRVYEL
jgi:hypothetical protein